VVIALVDLTTAVILCRRRVRSALPVALAAAAALVCGLLFTWATDPVARLGMVQWLHDAIDSARRFGYDRGTIRAGGRDLHGDDLPWWYVPGWLGVQLPLLTLIALLAGIGALAARVRRLPAIPLVPIALQAIGLPLLVVASGAVLYDGIRHLLFMLPALLALPAIAFALLDRGKARVVMPLAAVVVVAASLFSAIQWAPYAYAYLNPLGSLGNGLAWDLDYWGVSTKEGVLRLRRAGLDPIYVKPSQQPGILWGAYNTLGPPTPGSGLYVFLRWDRASDYGCKVLFTIKRGGHVLGEGARCPRR
jgi:hypothetical protein